MKYRKLKYRLLFILLSFLSSSSFSQYYYYYNDNYYDKELVWEVGGSFGTMHAYTDVGRRKLSLFLPSNFDLKSTRTNASFYIGFLYHDAVGLRLEATTGSVSAADSNGTYKYRNLHFQSSITELAVIGEIHPLMFKYWENMPRLSPYVTAGIGIFSFNPQATYQNRWVDLKPLSTEGQGFKEYPDRKPYRLSNVCLPFGAGLKYEASAIFTVRAEVLARYTFTDYLDDASLTSIDPALYKKYFTDQKAVVAEALTNRTKEINPTSNYGTIYKGGARTKDKYVSFNLKFGITLGRERIR